MLFLIQVRCSNHVQKDKRVLPGCFDVFLARQQSATFCRRQGSSGNIAKNGAVATTAAGSVSLGSPVYLEPQIPKTDPELLTTLENTNEILTQIAVYLGTMVENQEERLQRESIHKEVLDIEKLKLQTEAQELDKAKFIATETARRKKGYAT